MNTPEAPIKGEKLAEGKTKQIFRHTGTDNEVVLFSKDDITAGDGKRHDVVPGKGAVSNGTTCNVFSLLNACGVPTAFKRKLSDVELLAEFVNMIPIEVVWRRRAAGSEIERRPFLPKLHIFPQSVVQFFLKTSNKDWKGQALPVDDPLMRVVGDKVELLDPHKPIHDQKPFLVISLTDVIGDQDPAILTKIETVTRKAFLVLERGYQLVDFEIIDGKIEFGITLDGRLVIADVIDAESIRLMRGGKHFDKQPYREGGLNPEIMQRFGEVLKATESFRVPRQQVVVWTGSKDDDVEAFRTAAEKILGVYPPDPSSSLSFKFVARSAHKQPMTAVPEFDTLIQEIPDSVVIAYVGLSNGAGPTLSADTTVPLINVPATFSAFANDIWSSVRLPSDVPAMTVEKPANAVLAALNILSARNPYLYMVLRSRVEERLVNTVKL